MESPSIPACPRCGEPRILAPECPRCGVVYSKARVRSGAGAPPGPPPEPASSTVDPRPALTWQGDLDEARTEARLLLFALPVTLAVMGWLSGTRAFQGLFHIVFTMWVHELGHAVTAWFCGIPALPGPWKTLVGETRSTLVFAGLAFLLVGLVFRGILLRFRPWVVAGALGLLLQFVGTVLLVPSRAQQAVVFGGDGGCLVLGALLMASLYAPRDSALRRGWLHWGFLVIGGAAFMDVFRLWWAVRTDFARIPFGENEGMGASDPSVLVDRFGWDELALIHRYNALGLACLAGLALLYSVGLWRARAAPRALEARSPLGGEMRG